MGGNILSVGYGSMRDCSLWHGWLVGVPIDTPASVTAWAAGGGGAWGGAIWGVAAGARMGTIRFVPLGTRVKTGGTGGAAERGIGSNPAPSLGAYPAYIWFLTTGNPLVKTA